MDKVFLPHAPRWLILSCLIQPILQLTFIPSTADLTMPFTPLKIVQLTLDIMTSFMYKLAASQWRYSQHLAAGGLHLPNTIHQGIDCHWLDMHYMPVDIVMYITSIAVVPDSKPPAMKIDKKW